MRRRCTAAVGMLLVAVFGAIVGASSSAFAAQSSRDDVYKTLARKVALPAYENLATTTATLQQAVTTLCATNTAANLDAARAAWLDAWEAWNRTRVFRFAPPSFVTAGVSYPSAAPAEIDALANGGSPSIGPPFTSESLLQQTGTSDRGLEVIDYLLFGPALSAGGCSLAAASSEIVAATAQQVLQAWSSGLNGAPPLVDELADPTSSQMYGKLQKALNDIVNGMVMASLDAGTEVTAKLQPNARKRATIHTGTRVQDLLAAVQAAWEGDPNGKKGDGVKTLVASMSPTSADRTSQALHTAIAAAKQLPPSLADASPAQLRRTHKAVAKLSRELDAEIATELGVRLQVSDSDGDS